VAALLGACTKGDSGSRAAEVASAASVATAASTASATSTATAGSATGVAGATDDASGAIGSAVSADAGAASAGDPVAAKSIGHTSFVLKVTLGDGSVGAFKARSKRPLGDRRYRGEIAAYRLGVALGLTNVPRALPRAFRFASLRAACGRAPSCAEQLDREAVIEPDGSVRGAFLPWIDGYRVMPLEEAAWRARWEPWLTDPRATIPADERPLAAALSTLVVFDYLTANWDRWSGGNVARDGSSGELLFVDNDGAFYERPPLEALARQLAFLRRVTRFSRRFVSALRTLDEAKLREAFGEEPPGEPLLTEAVVAGVEERRRAVLQMVDARAARAGTQVTLTFE
jgi:hypothetical protein